MGVPPMEIRICQVRFGETHIRSEQKRDIPIHGDTAAMRYICFWQFYSPRRLTALSTASRRIGKPVSVGDFPGRPLICPMDTTRLVATLNFPVTGTTRNLQIRPPPRDLKIARPPHFDAKSAASVGRAPPTTTHPKFHRRWRCTGRPYM